MLPRILLAGMNRFPNQFSRYLESKGCETVHVSGDPGGHIPTDCEAVIITKCQISHEKFYKTKELYKDLDKPVFITDFGITPIRERLEAFLKDLPRVENKETVMSKAFKEASQSDKINDMPIYMKTNDKADKIIEECHRNNVSIKETYEKLKSLRQPDGSAYSVHYISSLRGQLGMKPREPVVEEIKEKVVAPTRERRAEPAKLDKAGAVFQILSTTLSTDQKAQLIWNILTGQSVEPQVVVRKTPEGLQFFATNPINSTEKPLITLSQVQAIAIVQNLTQVEDFATDPNV